MQYKKYIHLYSTRDIDLCSMLNDPAFEDYEVLSIFLHRPEVHCAYLKLKEQVEPEPIAQAKKVKIKG